MTVYLLLKRIDGNLTVREVSEIPELKTPEFLGYLNGAQYGFLQGSLEIMKEDQWASIHQSPDLRGLSVRLRRAGQPPPEGEVARVYYGAKIIEEKVP